MEFQLNNRFLCLYEAEILSGLKKKISAEVFLIQLVVVVFGCCREKRPRMHKE